MRKIFIFFFLGVSFLSAKVDSNKSLPRCDTKGSYTLALDKGAVFMEGEYLYWKPYAFIPYFVRSEVSAAAITTNRKEPQLSLKAHSGYRLNIGFYLPTPSWYTNAQYTQLFSEGNSFISTNGDPLSNLQIGRQRASLIWPYKDAASGSSTNPVQANAHERLRLKLVDLVLSRSFKTKYFFTFDPYFGLRYARVKVDMRILYSQPQLIGPYTGFIGTIDVDLTNNFNAWGLRTGFKTNWKLGSGFEIFGNASLSSLLGTFLLKNNQTYFRFGQSAGELFDVLSTSCQKITDIQLAYQFALGLIWGKKIKNQYYLGMKLGYETNIWPDFVRVKAYPIPLTSFESIPHIFPFKNNLSTQGITASMRLDF